MKQSALAVDPKRYGRLLARKLPAVIRTGEENERLIADLQDLDERYDDLTPEECEYADLLGVLIKPSKTPIMLSKARHHTAVSGA